MTETYPPERFETALMEPLPVGRWARYFSALGRFFHVYTRTESALNATISNFINERIGPKKNKRNSALIAAILGGSRFAGSRDTLKRLLRITHSPKTTQDEVQRIFLQLGEISFFRDRIAHNFTIPTSIDGPETWFGIDNSLTSREFEQLETLCFTPEILMDMAYDLFRIPDMLSFVLNEEGKEFVQHYADGLEDSLIRQSAREYLVRLHEPWRYKASQLKRTGPKHVRSSQRPAVPPEPSRG
jgi:hypothetical protein